MSNSTGYPCSPLFDCPYYTTEEVALAAGIAPDALRAWINNKPIVVPLGRYDRRARKGVSLRLTLRRAISVAIAAELERLGIEKVYAGQVSYNFTDTCTDKRPPLLESAERLMLIIYPPPHRDTRAVPLANTTLNSMFVHDFVRPTLIAIRYGSFVQLVTTRLPRRGEAAGFIPFEQTKK